MATNKEFVPQYHRIKQILLEEIERDAYRPDEPFITERQICSRFGVSRATAVRTLSELVHEGVVTRRRALGTFVARPAAALSPARPDQPQVTGGFHTIGCIVPRLTSIHVMNIIRGIEHACKPANYRLLLFESEMSPEIEQRAILQAREAGAQGLIVYPVEGNANLGCFEQLQRDRVPFVLVDRYFPALACDVVVPNNVALAYKLTTFLIEAGHRHVATLWSEVACTSVHDRMSGYKLALQNHGIAVEPALMDLRTYETLPEQERHALLTTWIGAPNSPTAYLAVNAGTLATVARDLRALGVHIPGDAALVSMDSTTVESILAFATATADLPSYDIGQSAVRLLRERLEGAADRPPQHIVLPASIQANALGDGVTQPVPGANGELTARNVSPVEQPTVVGAS